MLKTFLTVTMLVALSIPSMAQAQLVTPSSHWGSQLLPERQERTEFGLHFLGFTRFGKEVFTGTDQYTFTPYNDMDETLGFNLLSLSHYDVMERSFVSSNSLWRRWTLSLGIIDDHIPEFLQNSVIHWANWRGKDRLRRVPREATDTQESSSYGPTRVWPPLLSFSDEYFLRIPAQRKRIDGKSERIPTPAFIGGGYTVGTLNQEAFVHAGTSVVQLGVPERIRLGPIGRGLQLRSVGAGVMVRAGVLAPGIHLKDLTGSYATVQGVGRVTIDVWSLPTEIDLALTSSIGFFVESRTPEQWAMIRELGDDVDPASVYAAKTPVNERFVSLRVRIGEFTVETYNDLIGGKDKGPSFGAHVGYAIDPVFIHRVLGGGQ